MTRMMTRTRTVRMMTMIGEDEQDDEGDRSLGRG